MYSRSGLIDYMFTDRRDKFDQCIYWEVNKENTNLSKLDYLDQEPSGTFYAKISTSQNYNTDVIGGVFMVDSETITIESSEDLRALRKNFVVKFRDELYRVDDVTKKPKRKNNQFNDEVGYTYYVSLKR